MVMLRNVCRPECLFQFRPDDTLRDDSAAASRSRDPGSRTCATACSRRAIVARRRVGSRLQKSDVERVGRLDLVIREHRCLRHRCHLGSVRRNVPTGNFSAFSSAASIRSSSTDSGRTPDSKTTLPLAMNVSTCSRADTARTDHRSVLHAHGVAADVDRAQKRDVAHRHQRSARLELPALRLSRSFRQRIGTQLELDHLARRALPVSMWNGARVLTVLHSPRPFQPPFASSIRPSIHFV